MLSPGQRFGPFEIVARLGAGGMGEVYRARDTQLNRDVAIKVLPETFAGDPDRVARFSREAQVLAALSHPNIAAVYGIESGALVMELVEGEDLSAVIARGPLAHAEALPFARQIAEALEAAHDAGVVHRDLKPANIKIKHDGTVRVLDFGLAKLGGPGTGGPGSRDSGPGATMTSPAMTGLGIILGTASYMSPEQAKGRPVDRRADIWAFGAVWFEMLTGRAPFPGETITDVIAAVVTRDPDWTQLPAATPPEVGDLIRRCLDKNPRQRLRDIGEVRLALERLGSDAERQGAPPSRPTRSVSLGWVAAGVLLVALVASIFWPREANQAATAPVIEYDVVPAAKTALRLDTRPALAISPDGSLIVFAATESGITRLYVRRRNDAGVRALPGTEGATEPVFSPDGKWLAFSNPSELMRMPLDGKPVPIMKHTDPRGFTWLNNRELVVTPETAVGLSIVAAAGGTPKPLTTLDPKANDRTHRWPSAVPGGKAVLFTVGSISSPDDYDDSRIDAVIVATGERRPVMQGASFVRVLPNGFLMYAKAGEVFAVPFDSERLVTIGTAVPVLKDVSSDPTTGATHVAFDATGTLAYVAGGLASVDRQLVWVDRKGAATPLDIPPGLYNDIRISPEGDRIALITGSSGSGDVSIYDTHSTALRRFTFDGRNATPLWSRDGQSLYYASLHTSGELTSFKRRPADGSRDAEEIGSIKARAYLEAIARNEATAYLYQYALRSGQLLDIARFQIPGGQPSLLIGGQGSQYASAISPDGRWLAYQSDESGRPEIFVRDLTGAGGSKQVSTTGGEEPHWSISGNEIFYRNNTEFMSAAVITKPEFRSNPPAVLFDGIYNLRTETGISYDVHPKTGTFLMVRPAGQVAGAPAARVRVVTNWIEGRTREQQAPK